MTLDTHYTIPTTVMLQSVDDETLLFDSATELFFTLNDVGTVMWEIMSENSTLRAVYDELMEAYDVPGDQLEADVISFAMALLQQGLILSAE
jgi:hypothetical protein